MKISLRLCLLVQVWWLLGVISCAVAQDYAYEKPPFNYWARELRNPVARLQQKLDSGTLVLPAARNGKQDSEQALLLAVLRELEVPPASQVLVFSKTSLQRDRMAPQHPRAIYFNEQTYVGVVPGGLLELAVMEPELGPVFYQLDPDRPERKVPRFDRTENCMSCHGGATTDYLPGLLVRSVYPDAKGEPLYQAGTSLIDQTSPLATRWGGWYVSGNTSLLQHRGNALATLVEGNVVLQSEQAYNQVSLEALFPTKPYLRPTSDVLSLLLLEHQVGLHNRITKAHYEVRNAIERRQELMRELEEPATEALTGSALSVANSHAEKVLAFLLFAGEAALPDGGIQGAEETKAAFLAPRKATKDGRSLRDLQLLTRILKYRCSYLIYTAEWDALPPPFLDLLYHKLYNILTNKEPVKGYEHLVPSERQQILEILRETKPGLPVYWK